MKSTTFNSVKKARELIDIRFNESSSATTLILKAIEDLTEDQLRAVIRELHHANVDAPNFRVIRAITVVECRAEERGITL